MKAVTFNPIAISDLDEIISYITQYNPDAAGSVRTAIFETAECLASHPGLGIRPRFSAPRFAGIRFIPASSYPNTCCSIVKAQMKSKYSVFFTDHVICRLSLNN